MSETSKRVLATEPAPGNWITQGDAIALAREVEALEGRVRELEAALDAHPQHWWCATCRAWQYPPPQNHVCDDLKGGAR